MTDRTSYPPRLEPAELAALARTVDAAGGAEAVARRLGLPAEDLREMLVGEREWPEWVRAPWLQTSRTSP